MSAIIKFVMPTDLLFQPGHEKSAAATQKEKATEPRTIGEPERKSCKPPIRGASQTFATVEVFVLVVFLILALAGMLGCFAELYHLLGNPAKTSQPRSAEFAAFSRERSFGFSADPRFVHVFRDRGSRFRRCGRGARTTLMAKP